MIRNGLALHRQGRLAAAERLYRALLAAQPNEPNALQLLGTLLHQKGENDEAERLLRNAVTRRPNEVHILVNLGAVLQALGKHDDAREIYRAALRLAPNNAGAVVNLGTVEQSVGNLAGAIALYRRATELDPAHALAWQNLGLALDRQGDGPAALTALAKAAAAAPGDAEPHYNMGVVAHRLGALADAAAHYAAAVRLRPGHFRALTNLGTVERDRERYDAALAAYDAALAADANCHEARFNRALALLTVGRLDEGFAEYERRWDSPTFPWKRRPYPQPPWRGQRPPAPDAALTIWAEQGVGDEVMFASFVPAAVATGWRCIVECDRRLVPLYARSFPRAIVVPRLNPPDPAGLAAEVTAQVAVGSLPYFLRGKAPTGAAAQSYLRPDAQRRGELRARYAAARSGPLIGISWRSGNKDVGTLRSAALERWGPIFALPGVRFVNLQYGDCRVDLAAARAVHGIDILHDESVDPLADLDAFAAQIAALDFVVSIDNSTVHFAGALGIPTLTLLTTAAEWRWGAAGETTYWYRDMRLFRQRARGDWTAPLAAAAADLRRRIQGG